ncbi:MAG: gamma-glutamyltransferase family protein [Pseudomonadota bacterium]
MPQSFTTRPEIRGTFGAVTSTHWIASTVGFGILEKGGNAFDAAVATGFTLQIVEPHLNGPGGEVPVIVHAAGEDRPRVLCGQGVAPAAATIDAIRAQGYDRMPGMGLTPAVVPGSFDAWMRLLLELGTMRLRDVLEPAIYYAREGYPLVHRAAEAIHAIAPLFTAEWHHSAEVWVPDGALPMPGQKVCQPQIADAYQRILDESEMAGGGREAEIEAARRAWYQGFVAETVDRFYRMEQADGEGGRSTGLLTGQDFAEWQSSWEETVSTDFHGVTIHKTGPWGQGPALLMALGMLEARGIADVEPGSADWIHLSIEALKRGLADRDAYFGDPDFVDIPLKQMLSPDYLDARAASIGAAASLNLMPGDPWADGVDRAALLTELAANPELAATGVGEPTFADLPEIEGDTCHLDTVDQWGNLVSATPSGGWLQSAPAVPGLGFNITTRGQMFWLDDRLPSHVAPRRRPRTTLTPTVVTKDGKPLVGLGSPGGDQQDQWALGLLLRHLVQGLNLQAAIDAPLFHSGHYINSFAPRHFTPGVLHIEDRVDPAIRQDLMDRGHKLTVQPAWSLGRLCAAGFRRDGMVRAAATPRFVQAYAVGR